MKKYLCPSMMCANYANLEQEVKSLDLAGVDIFHIDIMDGNFVPNFAMGIQDIMQIRKATQKKIDVHLMIENPIRYVELFANLGVDILYVHPEADTQPSRTLDKIHQLGKKVGLAINPGTSVSFVKELLPLVDYVMVMTVNPGFAGQSYLEYVDSKIEELIQLKDKYSFDIMVDGAISPEKIRKLFDKGVTGFVLGTSALFGKEESYSSTIKRLRGVE